MTSDTSLLERAIPKSFNGVFQHKVDLKGRVSMPAPFRKMVELRTQFLRAELQREFPNLAAEYVMKVEEDIHLAPSADKTHLVGFLGTTIEKLTQSTSIENLERARTDRESEIVDNFITPGRRTNVDKAGRIGIARRPVRLLGLADSPCVFVGKSDRFHLYNCDHYIAMRLAEDADFELEDELS